MTEVPDTAVPDTEVPDAEVPDTAAQAAALLAQLSPAEKIAFLHQHQPAVERLGLAAFHTGCEALHGVAWIGRATVFPQAVGLGATWDRDLVRRVGEAVSTEVRAFRQDTENAFRASDVADKHPMVSLNVWAPVVNLLRDPRWGRNEEGYSEDPHATAELATAYCRGLRGDHPAIWRTTPVLKHFLAYNVETDRDVIDITVPPRVLHEYELPAFRGPIEAGVAAGVMPGYNLTNGVPNHVHPLINDALRAWNPELVVCSDAQAPSNLVDREKHFATHVESHAAALKAGVDSYTDNGPDARLTIERFTEALAQGLITEADIDASVGRLLAMRAATGEFDIAADPYAGIRAEVISSPAHNALALEAARAAVVLLKNENEALPLVVPEPEAAPAHPGPAVAVIGHLGNRVLTDWYSGELPYAVSIADGLRTAFGDRAVTAVDGADVVSLRAGETVFGPFCHQDWGTSVQCPVPVRTLQAVENGKYLTLTGEGDTEVLADAATPDGWVVKELWEFHPAVDGQTIVRSNASGRYLRVGDDGRLVADAETAEEATAFVVETLTSGIRQAVAAATSARRAIVVLGNDPHINGRETIDRDGLALPADQEALLRAVVEANPDTTLVVVSSYPYAIGWAARHVPAIVWTAHGGQELGNAVVDVLTGAHNPAGRLPQTWYASDADLPAPEDYDVIGSGWTYQYSQREHLYAFGHGLSYTTFEYGDLVLKVSEDQLGSLTIFAETQITNSGTTAGQEVVQLYSHALEASVPTPLRRLQGFERIELAPGESRTVVFEVPAERLAHWSEDVGALRVESGEYEFGVGRSSADLPSSASVKLTIA
ncbi:glycoside hydrolase family 3 C-terminal domain-containing protein [Catenulispora rubra]|uniref:glycoside hydrolase family 3 C-terminal domain-containing protein n=1 Tax=Catenulispora rubra TaxID=280293 RepID=UPI002B274D21|nr:glycoside hydrolase family 3 C-terminal domain-containing protein [Catenulispora rubra]